MAISREHEDGGSYRCDRLTVGYAGRRYEVRAENDKGEVTVLGWTNEADGGALSKMARLHPSFRNPTVRDLNRDDPS